MKKIILLQKEGKKISKKGTSELLAWLGQDIGPLGAIIEGGSKMLDPKYLVEHLTPTSIIVVADESQTYRILPPYEEFIESLKKGSSSSWEIAMRYIQQQN